MNQHNAPLYEALARRRGKGEASFHVPGHKFGAGLDGDAERFFGPVMGIDYTEINGLDDLHHPEGVILKAEQLAAACFGSEKTFFLIGGSTVGNLAVLTTVCSRDDVILVQRNAHKSVLHGLMLAGARAVFLHPVPDPVTGLAGGVPLETLEAALDLYPKAKAVFLTNPNYYGMGFDLGPYAELAHRYGVPLLIDEAHGAHFGLHRVMPPSALSRGADAVIQSTHKMLTAMTMGAMLHVQGDRLDRNKLKQRLSMLQSSSPSYPLMASLDLARRLAAVSGEQRTEEALRNIVSFKKHLSDLHRLQLINDLPSSKAYDFIDPFKLTVFDAAGVIGGFQLQEELERHGIIAEMADDRHVVLACSLATSKEDLDRLGDALRRIESRLDPMEKSRSSIIPAYDQIEIGEPVPMTMDLPDGADLVRIPLDSAAGRLAAESVIPYPPGIPLLFPGERIRPEVIEQIRRLAQAGARFQGTLQDDAGCSILVKKSNGE